MCCVPGLCPYPSSSRNLQYTAVHRHSACLPPHHPHARQTGGVAATPLHGMLSNPACLENISLFGWGKVEGLICSRAVADKERETSFTAALLPGIARSVGPWIPSRGRYQELSALFLQAPRNGRRIRICTHQDADVDARDHQWNHGGRRRRPRFCYWHHMHLAMGADDCPVGPR